MEGTTVRRWVVRGVASGVAAAIVLLLTVFPASAADAPQPVWKGVTAADAVALGWDVEAESGLAGGWAGSPQFTQSVSAGGWIDLAVNVRRPYIVGTTWRLNASVFPTAGTNGNSMFTTNGQGAGAFCAATATSQAAEQEWVSVGGAAGGYWNNEAAKLVTYSWSCPSNKPYLISLKISLPVSYTVAGGMVFTTLWWWAGSEAAKTFSYWPTDEYCTAEKTLMGASGFSPCAYVGGGVGGMGGDVSSTFDAAGQFNTACAGAPSAEWLSFTWIGPMIGFYAKCLFVPSAGVDWGRLQRAWDASFIGQTIIMFGGIGQSLHVTAGQCSSLMHGTFPGTTATIDLTTCSPAIAAMGTYMRPIVAVVCFMLTVIASWNLMLHAIGLHWFGYEEK